MGKLHSRWRSVSNIFGLFLSSLALILLFISIVLSFFHYDKALWIFITSILLNYFVTIGLSITIINSVRKSDLFISFYLFIFICFPYIGVLLYFLLGFDSIHEGKTWHYSRIYSKYRKCEEKLGKNIVIGLDSDMVQHKAFYYNQEKHGIFTYRNVDIESLNSSIDILREMTNLMMNANKFIHMEFYQFCDGLIFEYLLGIFEKKCSEGVEIRLIVDDAGTRNRLSQKSRRRLKNAGVEVRIFSPLLKKNDVWWQFRNHNKIVIIDNEYAFCGSCNIADEYFNITSEYFQTTEFFAKVTGDVVSSLNASFLAHWEFSLGPSKTREKEWNLLELDRMSYFTSLPYVSKDKDITSQFLSHSSVNNELIIKDNLIQLISNAKRSIVISTPYFLPPKDLVNALKYACVFGVVVKILVPKNPDLINFYTTLNRQLFSLLLKHNIEIYEYFGFNHEKVMIVDDETAYFGSYNWDYRTLYLNFEHAFLVNSKKVVSDIKRFLDSQFKNSHRIQLQDLISARRRFVHKFFSLFIRVFKPFL